MNQFDNNNSVTFNTDKSITVILNSISTIETNKGDCTYNFDWSVLPNNTAFEVYWTCMTNIFTSTSTTPIPLVYIDLGNTNVYEAINKNTVQCF